MPKILEIHCCRYRQGVHNHIPGQHGANSCISCSVIQLCVISVSELGQLILCYEGCSKPEKCHYVFYMCACKNRESMAVPPSWTFTPFSFVLLLPVALLPTCWSFLLIHWGFSSWLIVLFFFSLSHTTMISTSRLLSSMSFSFPTSVPLTFFQHPTPIITIRALVSVESAPLRNLFQTSHSLKYHNLFFHIHSLEFFEFNPSNLFIPPLSPGPSAPFCFLITPHLTWLLRSIFPSCPCTSFCYSRLAGKLWSWLKFTLPSLCLSRAAPSCWLTTTQQSWLASFEATILNHTGTLVLLTYLSRFPR